MTSRAFEPYIIPAGYVTKHAIDLRKDDVVKLFGRVLSTRVISDAIMTDPETNERYIGDGVEVTTASYDGSGIAYTFAFFDELQMLLTTEVHEEDTLDDMNDFIFFSNEDKTIFKS